MKKTYWHAMCFNCGWSGSSKKTDGGGPIADTGDYDDLYCPTCGGDDIEDFKCFFELSFKEKIKLIFRRITFYGSRERIKNDKNLKEWIKEMEGK